MPAEAQQTEKIPRIGVLISSGPNDPSAPAPLVPELRDLGYVDGQNIVLEHRYARGNLNRLPDLAAELVNLPVNILVSGGIAASQAAKRATTTIPIVFSGTTDPVGRGLVTNLARPGGNITGVAFDSGSVILTKRLELLKKAVPTITRVAYIHGFDAMGQRTAVLIDKILRGTKPGNLPVEQPNKYDFIINLKTAKALGITIPPIVLYQATRVIR